MPNTPTELAALAAITPAALLLGWWLAHRSGQADQRRAQAELAPRLAKLDRNLAELRKEAHQLELAALEHLRAELQAAGDRAQAAGLQAYELTERIKRERADRLNRQLADTGRAIAARRRLAAGGKAGR